MQDTILVTGRCLERARTLKLAIGAMMALSLAVPFPGMAENEDWPKSKIECRNACMIWNKEIGQCTSLGNRLSSFEKVIGVIGLGCALGGLFLLSASRTSS
jgi:hypothetical protein